MPDAETRNADHERAALEHAVELVTTMANLLIGDRDLKRFGEDKQWRKSQDTRHDATQEHWDELGMASIDHLPALLDELLRVHEWMASEWSSSLTQTVGLAQVIADYNGTPPRQAARDLAIIAVRTALDPADHLAASHRSALLNVARAGTVESQLRLMLALAHLGGAVAAARPLERDGALFDFDRLVRAHDTPIQTLQAVQDPWSTQPALTLVTAAAGGSTSVTGEKPLAIVPAAAGRVTVYMTETVTYEIGYSVEEFAARMGIDATPGGVAAFLDENTGGHDGQGFDEVDAFEGNQVLDEIDCDERRTRNVDRHWGYMLS